MYKLCDMTGYTYNMSTYLGKDVKMQPRWCQQHTWQCFVSLGEWKRLAINFAWTIFYFLCIYLMTCIQMLSAIVNFQTEL
jgi:hypothetical protein